MIRIVPTEPRTLHSTLDPLVLHGFSIGSFLFAVSCGGFLYWNGITRLQIPSETERDKHPFHGWKATLDIAGKSASKGFVFLGTDCNPQIGVFDCLSSMKTCCHVPKYRPWTRSMKPWLTYLENHPQKSDECGAPEL